MGLAETGLSVVDKLMPWMTHRFSLPKDRFDAARQATVEIRETLIHAATALEVGASPDEVLAELPAAEKRKEWTAALDRARTDSFVPRRYRQLLFVVGGSVHFLGAQLALYVAALRAQMEGKPMVELNDAELAWWRESVEHGLRSGYGTTSTELDAPALATGTGPATEELSFEAVRYDLAKMARSGIATSQTLIEELDRHERWLPPRAGSPT